MKCIVYNDPETNVMCIVAPNTDFDIKDVLSLCVPYGEEYSIINDFELPLNRTFRDFWFYDFKTDCILIDINKARVLAHEIRRSCRASEFSILDSQCMNPATIDEALAKKVNVREDFSSYQEAIDSCVVEKELLLVIDSILEREDANTCLA